MPGQIPSTGVGPVFQPRVAPPAIAQAMQSGPPMNTGDVRSQAASTSGGMIGHRPSVTHGGVATGDPAGLATVRLYWCAWVSPATNTWNVNLSFAVQVTPSSWDTSSMDVDIQSATNSDFSAGVTTTTLTSQAHNVTVSPSIGPFTNNSYIYLRARAGLSGVYSEWTVPVRIRVAIGYGDGAEQMFGNIGFTLVLNGNSSENVYGNIGFTLVINSNTSESIWMNIGFPQTEMAGGEFVSYGDVDTSVPMPHMWCIVPATERVGNGVTAFAGGMGATQGTYSGIIQILIGSWTTVGATSWGIVAANGNAYTAGRKIEPYNGIVDPEHNEIEFIVPGAAYPPGHQIRGETNA